MHLSLLQWVLAGASPVLQLALLYVLVRGKLRTRFPFFFNYVAYTFATVVFILLAGRHLSNSQYFIAFWIISGVSMLITFLVLYEVFVNILKPYSALIDLGKMLFVWAALFLLLASALTAAATNGPQAARVCAAVLLFERCVQLMQCGLLLLFVLFQNSLGLSWRSQGMCIALGLGGFAALDLLSVVIRDKVPAWTNSLDTANTVLFVINWAFWFGAFLLPEPARNTAESSPKRLILQRWNEALVSYGYGQSAATSSTVESFLPGIEKTVDRVLARKIAL